jgi:hypothetical protein
LQTATLQPVDSVQRQIHPSHSRGKAEMTSRKKRIATIAASALIGVAGVAFVGFKMIQARKSHEPVTHDARTVELPSGDKEFNSDHVGVSFSFPSDYAADFSHENDGVVAWHVVTVQKAAPASGGAPANQPQVTVRIFETPGAPPPAEWVKTSKHAAPGGATATLGTLGTDPMASYIDTSGVGHAVVQHGDLVFYYSYPPKDPALTEIFQKMTATVGYPKDAANNTRSANWLNAGPQQKP